MLMRLEIQRLDGTEFNVMRSLTVSSKDAPEYEKSLQSLREQREMWARDYYRGRKFRITCDNRLIE